MSSAGTPCWPQFQPDAWRYVLTAMAPETADVEFTWQDFMDRINNELVANWGNLVNRMLGFAYKRFDGQVPAPGALTRRTTQPSSPKSRRASTAWARSMQAVKLKAALQEVRRLSQRVNQYLNENAPWKSIGEDPRRAATAVYVALQAIDWLKLMWAPILPHSQRAAAQHARLRPAALWPPVHRRWSRMPAAAPGAALRPRAAPAGAGKPRRCRPARPLREPSPLFVKLDDALMAEKLGAGVMTAARMAQR